MQAFGAAANTGVVAGHAAGRSRGAWWRGGAVLCAALAAAWGLAACGGGPSAPKVASAGSLTTQPVSSGPAGSLSSSGSSAEQALAFSRCVRRHGVPDFPDPNSSGVWPKDQVTQAAGSVQYPAATKACGYLLPDGGPGVLPSPAVKQQIWDDMAEFAHCMRSHGVPNWPGPTLDPTGRAIFQQPNGINENSPQISAKMHQCERVFPANIGVPPGA
jgi:hypothetical protein